MLSMTLFAQESYTIENKTLKEALEILSKKSNLSYIASEQLLQSEKTNNINAVKGIESALEKLLEGTGLKAVIKNDVIVIIKSEAKSEKTDNISFGDIEIQGDFLAQTSKEDIQNFGGSRTLVDINTAKDLGDSSISDSIKRIPGVIASKQDGTGSSPSSLNIGVRGMSQRLSPRTTVLMDGVPLAVAPYGQPQLSLAPVSFNMLSQIDLIRGGGTVRYGPQNVGGIINFITRDIPDDFESSAEIYSNYYTKGDSDLESKSVNLFAGGMINDKVGLGLFYDGMHGSTWREHSRNDIDNIMLKARYKINDDHEIKTRLSFYQAENEMPGGLTASEYANNPYDSKRPNDKFEGDRKEAVISYEGQISANTFLDAKTYFNESNREFIFSRGAPDISNRLDRLPRDYNVFGLEGRLVQKIQIGNMPTELAFGYRFLDEDANEKRYRRSHAVGANPYDTPEVINRDSHNETRAHSYYTDWRWEIDNFVITPGVRFEDVKVSRLNNLNDFSEDVKYSEMLPSLSMNYAINDEWAFFMNYNRSFGSVQHLQLNLQDNGKNILKPELADIFEVGKRYLGDNGSLEATLFHIDFEDQISYDYTNAKFANNGRTIHKGIEIAGRWLLNTLHSSLEGSSLYGNYTYLDATYKSSNIGNQVEFTSKNMGLVGLEYMDNTWSTFAEVYYQSKQYADNLNTKEENASGSLGLIPSQTLVNIGYTKKLYLSKDYDFSLSLGIKNLFNKETFTRSTDTLGNGKYIGMPRTAYFSLRIDY
jgi:Fe(3+) dicitrate transport protein